MGLPGPTTPGQQGYFARIEASGRHLLTLIDDVLDVSKIEAGELTVDRRPAPLHDVVEAALALVRPQARVDARSRSRARRPTCWPRCATSAIRTGCGRCS
jgi:signal transduction histidine kinase